MGTQSSGSLATTSRGVTQITPTRFAKGLLGWVMHQLGCYLVLLAFGCTPCLLSFEVCVMHPWVCKPMSCIIHCENEPYDDLIELNYSIVSNWNVYFWLCL